jgi:hypothetical protein
VDELRGFTRVPVLTTIPRILTAADAGARRRRLVLTAGAVAAGVALVAAGGYYLAHGNEGLVRSLTRGLS